MVQWRRYVPFNNAGTAVLFPTSPLALIIRYSCSTDTDTTSYRAVSRAPGVPGNFTGTIPEIGTFQPTLHGDGDPSPHFNMSTQRVFLLISADGVMSLLYWLIVSGTTSTSCARTRLHIVGLATSDTTTNTRDTWLSAGVGATHELCPAVQARPSTEGRLFQALLLEEETILALAKAAHVSRVAT